MLIAVIYEETMEAALAAAAAIHPAAGAVEFRLDPMAGCDPAALVRAAPCPAIMTCRSPAQGGARGVGAVERTRRLRAAIDAGADWIDLEYGTEDERLIGATRNSRVILSAHPPVATPDGSLDLYRKMKDRAGVEVLKIVPFADSIADNLVIRNLLRLARSDRRALAAFCLGGPGRLGRLLATAWGSWGIYGALRRGRESAAGQLTMEDLAEHFRVETIGPTTRLFGILGHPIGHSLSPAVHNEAFRDADIDARYLPFEAERLAEFLPLLAELPVAGCSVTLPHKESIVPHLDVIEPAARAAGSINTVVRRDGRFHGANTDLPAAMRVIEAAVPIEGRQVILLGAGGAARPLAGALVRGGARLQIRNRTPDRARRLAAAVGAEWCALDDAGTARCDLLINATPVGMHPETDATPVPDGTIEAAAVFDLIYRPAETRLLREARGRGAHTFGGLEMFLAQAADQFQLFTGQTAPCSVMRQAAEARLADDAGRRGDV